VQTVLGLKAPLPEQLCVMLGRAAHRDLLGACLVDAMGPHGALVRHAPSAPSWRRGLCCNPMMPSYRALCGNGPALMEGILLSLRWAALLLTLQELPVFVCST